MKRNRIATSGAVAEGAGELSMITVSSLVTKLVENGDLNLLLVLDNIISIVIYREKKIID